MENKTLLDHWVEIAGELNFPLSLSGDEFRVLVQAAGFEKCARYVGGYSKGIIDSLGLSKHTDDIFAGLIESIKFPFDLSYIPFDASGKVICYSLENMNRDIKLLTDSQQYMQEQVKNYIERWQMYHQLFKE